MVIKLVGKTLTKVFGSRNERMLKAYRRRVEQINALEAQTRRLTDAELKAQTGEFRRRIAAGERATDLMAAIMATAREAMDRAVGIRNIFNPQAGFDPGQLPAAARPAFNRVAAKIADLQSVEELGSSEPIPAWQQVEIPNEIYDAVRELHPLSRPPFRARPFDVQLIGGMVLGEGRIAEMKTGEGKTIVAPLACYVACLEGLQCHVVTVNDYLVQRDRDWVFPFYYHLGLTVGAIHPYHMQPPEGKARAYRCDVVYGTNSEFGFDYLRDNMKLATAEQVQKRRDFCIVDEIDSILIDEARTPLIISGPAHDDAPRYDLADGVARHLLQKQRAWDAADAKVQDTLMRIKGLEGDIRNARDKAAIPPMREEMRSLQELLPTLEAQRDRNVQFYELEREKKASHLTHDGVAEAQKQAGIGSFYVGDNMDFPHLLENALRAHAIYQRDKDYVVKDGEVIIVDEFTGRLMIGRQWSDGLHQAVEAKEGVKIKEETQTLATVTIQNYFKLYHRLAGMTGTAVTESTEFNEIYSLEVVCIPTNVPVVRTDRDDLIFLAQKDKWNAILDEIKRVYDVGRPVLVGTTSVEKSEMLAAALAKKYGIKHEVLNAKQHEREAHIVAHAGELGAVMIATNMAGRGTDIKLAPVSRADLVRHWQVRDLLPREADAAMSDDQLVALSRRHQLRVATGLKPAEVEAMGDEEIRLRLLRLWVAQENMAAPDKIDALPADRCEDLLDGAASFMLHRLRVFKHVEEMGGLHIVGTERHEARRIDNQLRGRAGRQGDRGSSRFFISLTDDLMEQFAGKATLTALSKLGMKEGDAIEHPWISKSVERAQRKVEERNYEIRKNLLEYDEVMEVQRNAFYHLRQGVLEGRDIRRVIFDYIEDAVSDAVDTYLDRDYAPTQVAEWCRQKLDVSIEPYKLRITDLHGLHNEVRAAARDEVRQIIDVTLGEYMSNDVPSEEWDLRGLAAWAMSRFSVDLKQNQLRQMSVDGVKSQLVEAALAQVERKDLSELAKFLDPLYAVNDLAEWSRQKFDLVLAPDDLAHDPAESDAQWRDRIAKAVIAKALDAYEHREVAYPVEFVLDMTFQAAQQNGPWAAEHLAGWANRRYEMGWTAEQVSKMNGQQLRDALTAAAVEWARGGKLEALVDKAIADHPDPQALANWAEDRLGTDSAMGGDSDDTTSRAALLSRGRRMLRYELTQLERFVLLQILDTAWKDHLYAMDQLKDSVGLLGYAEKDPRIEYKKEGAELFQQMRKSVRDRVTDLIFRAKLTAQAQVRNVYSRQEAMHADPAAAAASQGSDQQRADLEAAQAAGDRDGTAASRKARRAAAASANQPAQPKRPQYKERKKRR